MDVIRGFLREHVCGRRAGSLYLSGAPGTGKTACVSRILRDLQVRCEKGEVVRELKGLFALRLVCFIV